MANPKSASGFTSDQIADDAIPQWPEGGFVADGETHLSAQDLIHAKA